MEARQEVRDLPFEFDGRTGEYFRIWIVNVVLSILTLGIYSAWAKVRTKRYFYGNTRVDGTGFDYHAKPVAILKGRLIAVAVLVGYYITLQFLPLAEPVFLLLFMVALPWLVVRALMFNARNSSYRNVRFGFRSNYLEAAKVFIGMPLLVVLTLGLFYPYFMYRQKSFVVNNSGFGTAGFDFRAEAGSFYEIYLKAFGMLVLIAVLFAFVLPALAPVAIGQDMGSTEQAPGAGQLTLGLLPLLLMVPLYMLFFTYIQTATTNLVFNKSLLQDHQLQSTLSVGRMFWIYLTNFLAVVCSLGLLIPWASIRIARYRFENLSLQTAGSLDEFVAEERDQVRATGEELAEAFDVDLGL